MKIYFHISIFEKAIIPGQSQLDKRSAACHDETKKGRVMNNRILRFLVHGVLGILFFASLAYINLANLRAGNSPDELLSTLLLTSLPLFLLYFSIGLLFESWLHHREGGMGRRLARVLYLTPRIAGILIALFIGLFALDVFGMPGSIWERILGFLIHALPSIVLIAAAALSWRWEWVGALAFGLVALFLLTFVIRDFPDGLGTLLIIVLPVALVAALFLLGWMWRAEIRGSGQTHPSGG
jgi:hypothetical protein